MELTGHRLIFRECEPYNLPPLNYLEEDFALDPFVGRIDKPKFFVAYLGEIPIAHCVIYNPEQGGVEFGVTVAEGYRSKGYGSEAARVISDYCFSVLGFSVVHLKVLPINDRAIKSYKKAGFKKCGKIVVDYIEFVKMERKAREDSDDD